MSIAAIGSIVTTPVSPPPVQPVAAAPPPLVPQQASVTTLSDEALAQQALGAQPAQDAAAPSNNPTVTELVARDWAAGAAADNAVVQEALDALEEASRENLLRVQADAVQAYQDQAALEQQAVDDAATQAQQQHDAVVLSAINAGIRLAYGALPASLTGDPVLREPGQVDVVA